MFWMAFDSAKEGVFPYNHCFRKIKNHQKNFHNNRHVLLGWTKIVGSTAFHIPKAHQARVINVGNIIFSFIAFCYFCFPMWCTFLPHMRF